MLVACRGERGQGTLCEPLDLWARPKGRTFRRVCDQEKKKEWENTSGGECNLEGNVYWRLYYFIRLFNSIAHLSLSMSNAFGFNECLEGFGVAFIGRQRG